MELRNRMLASAAGLIGIGSAVLLLSQDARSQLGYLAGVRLQNTTPGIPDVGHANVSGTIRAGNGVFGSLQIGPATIAGYVLTTDGTGMGTWLPAPQLQLPFTGASSVASPAATFSVSNTGSGHGIAGRTSHGSGRGVFGEATAASGLA